MVDLCRLLINFDQESNEANKVLFHQEKCMIFLFKVFLNCFYVPLAFDRGSVRISIIYRLPEESKRDNGY